MIVPARSCLHWTKYQKIVSMTLGTLVYPKPPVSKQSQALFEISLQIGNVFQAN